ncbi:MAG TPA: lactate racemase domain-containing protein, partial [Verrucomicrobiae bacterium]|nr:lactate racemase domain-containing protein [Verrucomicrobiae bacterium]
MQTPEFPRMIAVRQKYQPSPPVDIAASVKTELARLAPKLKPGMRIAVGTGSRGISNISTIVASAVEFLKASGARPFLIPAMGSHGGATPEGQIEVLASYGITEALGAPIAASMDTVQLGRTAEGLDVLFSAEAKNADGIIVINRIKPHTDFQSDSLGSGLLKMLVVGLGKRNGAASYHRGAIQFGFETIIRSMAPVILKSAPIVGGIGIVEDQFHQTARIAFLPADEMVKGEARLFAQAKELMPSLPFDEIDLLIIDRIGKNISGSGMDPNIIGREIHGYSSSFDAQRQ